VAGRADAGGCRRGALDRRLAAGGSSGGPAGHGPAGACREGAGSCREGAGSCREGARHERSRHERSRHGGEIRRPARSTRGARSACRNHARRPRATGGGRYEPSHRRGRGGDGHPAGAGPSILDTPRQRRGRPANGGAGRPEPGRPTGPPDDPPDPLCGWRRARRLPPPRRTPGRGHPNCCPRDPSARETEQCDSFISIAHISSSTSRGGASPPARGRRGR
jgi:hypothetical protein